MDQNQEEPNHEVASEDRSLWKRRFPDLAQLPELWVRVVQALGPDCGEILVLPLPTCLILSSFISTFSALILSSLKWEHTSTYLTELSLRASPACSLRYSYYAFLAAHLYSMLAMIIPFNV